MTRTNYYTGRAPFILSPKSIIRDTGRQIDWDQVPEKYRSSAVKVTVNGAHAAGVESVTVDALPGAIPKNAILDFGVWEDVTVTVSDGSITGGDTTLGVAALSGPIPKGAYLEFSGGGYAVLDAAAAAGATSLTVEPLAAGAGLPGDTETATFQGGQKIAKLTAAAVAGATSITVEDLALPLEDDDEAHYYGTGAKTIQAGTVMAELSTGKIVPRADRPGSETATCILENTCVEDERSDALSGHGCIIGGVLFENLLPEATGSPAVIDSTFKSELQTAGVGTGFAFKQYANNAS